MINRNFLKVTSSFLLFVSINIYAEDKTKSLVDFFLPMQPVRPLVGAESGIWGTDNVMPRDTANGLEDPMLKNSCYWDGGILQGDDGRYHIYASRWDQSLNHNDGWNKGSKAIHAVSDNIMGPYRKEELLWPEWKPENEDLQKGVGHNIFGFKMHDGRYGVVTSEITPGTVFASDSPDGPFECLGEIKIDYNGYPEGFAHYSFGYKHMSNVMILPRPDGKYMIVGRSTAPLLSENGILGPYKIMDYPVYGKYLNLHQGFNEDPTVWYSGGLYHIVYNHWPSSVSYHFTSKDGVSDWRYRGEAFNKKDSPIFKYEDGTENKWVMIERPTAVMGKDGHVSHFHFSVINVNKGGDAGNDRDGSKIVIVPFDGKAFDEYMAEVVNNDPEVEVLPIDPSNAPDDKNILNSLVYSFEKIGVNEGACWFVQHKDQYTVTKEKAYDGEYSLKFSNLDPTLTNALQVQGSFNSNLVKPNIKSGNYEMSAYFWLDEESPSKVEIVFQNASPGLSAIFDLTGVEKNKWLKVSTRIAVGDFTKEDRKINVQVKNGQTGTFYIDKIELVETVDKPEDEGFGNKEMLSFERGDNVQGGADGWWAAHPDNWFRSGDMSSDGSFSLCCSIPKQSEAFDPWIQTDDKVGENASRIPENGEYHFEYDLFLDPDVNKGLKSIYCYNNSGGWNPSSFEQIQTLEKGKWVKISTKSFKVTEAPVTGKTTLKVNKDACVNDDVLFYIDNLRLVNSATIGLEELTGKSYSVSAVDSRILIDGLVNGEKVQAFDLSGKMVKSIIASGQSLSIALSEGVYFIKVGEETTKVVL